MDSNELTPYEHNIVQGARLEWRDLVIRNGSLGLPKVTELVTRIYSAIGLPAPKIYRFGSPLACILSIPYLAGRHGTGYFETAVLKKLKGPQLNTLGTRFQSGRVPFGRQGDGRWERLADLLIGNMELPIKDQVSNGFIENFQRDLLEATDGACKPDREEVLGDTYRTLLGPNFVHQGSRIQWWNTIVNTGIYWWPYHNFAVVSGYPTAWHRGLREIPHHESEAAIQFADDYRIWVWQGVRVTAQIIAFPETITIDQIRKEKNAEVQRIMISRMGAGKYLRETKCVLVDMDSMTLQGSAPRALMRDDLGNMWLVGTDGSTARVYTMAVPPEVRTCKEAHESISGFDEKRLIAEA